MDQPARVESPTEGRGRAQKHRRVPAFNFCTKVHHLLLCAWVLATSVRGTLYAKDTVWRKHIHPLDWYAWV